ncbi:MAG: bifunctional YncE family protein/alkaline phosphatase family protein [Prolixibacteraceae bacterium]|jgi:YVTN family beta-propeller protein
MRKSLTFILSVVFILTIVQGRAQSKRTVKDQQKYRTSYENSTLAGNELPVLMPFNRWIDPAGTQIYFGDKELENHALDCALSPDGKWMAVEGRYSVVIINPETKKLVDRFVMRTNVETGNVSNTFSGIIWRKAGKAYEIYWSASGSGKSYVFKAGWDGKKISILKTFPFPAVDPAESALPNEVLVREESGSPMLYVVLNGNNTLEKLDIHSGKTVWSVPTGEAPFGIAEANGKLYVTNWAGSTPEKSDANVAGVPWGKVKVDPETGATREGTVSVFDPSSGKLLKEITVGLHPNDIVTSPDAKFVYVANSNSDMVSVIKTANDEVSEEISVRIQAKKNDFWGDSPNGLGISDDGKTLYVANGMDNALAVVHLGEPASASSEAKASRISGFIPTGAYPGAVAVYQDKQLYVANIEAEGARIASVSAETGKTSYNSHKMMASVSIIPVPEKQQLQEYTAKVEKINQLFRLALIDKMPRKSAAPVPVPARIGEPSVFKHVLYIIKENRTYDQVLGDVKKGDGDPSLCTFGEMVTPNAHKLVDEFHLMDNYHASGKCSAEGHQWTDMAIVTDYIEKNMRSWFRSYPHVQEDALVYAPTGFIWGNALKHGKSVRIYGEASVPEFINPNESWTSIYEQFKSGQIFKFINHTTIKPVEPILSQEYPSYDSHKIPDVLRAKVFIDEMKKYENMEGDQWPELMVMALPNDHTGGTRPGLPTPRAQVADNDLALGQIVEAISHSRFWNNTVIFVTEDDSQAGWDHVSAYRTVGMVISPYAKRNTTVRTNYNQVDMVRTIEQILGIPPMNISDATAIPMFDCFDHKPDLTPYKSVPNQIQLDEMNKETSQLKGKELHYALKSMEPQFDRMDAGNDDLFNRILWFAMKGKEAYPKKYAGKDEDDGD